MDAGQSYHVAFKAGGIIQLLLLPTVLLNLHLGLLALLLNTLATMFVYPMLAIWLSERTWTPVDPALGPHQ